MNIGHVIAGITAVVPTLMRASPTSTKGGSNSLRVVSVSEGTSTLFVIAVKREGYVGGLRETCAGGRNTLLAFKFDAES